MFLKVACYGEWTLTWPLTAMLSHVGTWPVTSNARCSREEERKRKEEKKEKKKKYLQSAKCSHEPNNRRRQGVSHAKRAVARGDVWDGLAVVTQN
jgi:hypothetical protein